MGDKWERHPGMDGLIGRVDLARPPSGPGGEDESAPQRQHEGQPDKQRAPPRFSHNSILAGSRSPPSPPARKLQASAACLSYFRRLADQAAYQRVGGTSPHAQRRGSRTPLAAYRDHQGQRVPRRRAGRQLDIQLTYACLLYTSRCV